MENLGNFGKLNDKLYQLNWINNYMEYLALRKGGLKKKAQLKLKEFFHDFVKQNKFEKRKLIDGINDIAFHTGDYNLYLPSNINQLFQLEIIDWIKDEIENPLAYKCST